MLRDSRGRDGRHCLRNDEQHQAGTEIGGIRERGLGAGKTLVISGRITRLVEGNGTLRLLVGMGAGSSYFDATTDLADGESGSVLGHITTDKNSWALGGRLAATQTVQSFMQGAAEKIAQQLRDGKKGAKKSPT